MVLRLGPGKSHYMGLLLHGSALEGVSRRTYATKLAGWLAGLLAGWLAGRWQAWSVSEYPLVCMRIPASQPASQPSPASKPAS